MIVLHRHLLYDGKLSGIVMRLKDLEEAENGNLNARGDVEKFKGEYKNIIKVQ